MSRIGNKAITVPAEVEITIGAGNEVAVKGPKGTLTRQFNEKLTINLEDSVLTVARPNETKQMKQLHGTTRALIFNMVEGVTTGYKIELEIVGIGYKAAVVGTILTLNVGYSHPVIFDVETGLTVACPTNKVLLLMELINNELVKWQQSFVLLENQNLIKEKVSVIKGKSYAVKKEKRLLRNSGKGEKILCLRKLVKTYKELVDTSEFVLKSAVLQNAHA